MNKTLNTTDTPKICEVTASPDCSGYPCLPMRLWRLGASESRGSRNLRRFSRRSQG